MKRRSSPRLATSSSSRNKYRHLQFPGSPSSAMLRSRVDCLELNDTAEVEHFVLDRGDMDKEILQSTIVHKGLCFHQGNRNRGKAEIGIDLNVIPDEPQALDVVSLPFRSNGIQQGSAAQEDDACVGVGAVQPTVEFIDVEESADGLTNLPINVDYTSVQWANEMIDIDAIVNQQAVATINVEVQNQPTEIISDMIVLDEESGANAGSPDAADKELSTRLTLGTCPPRTNDDGTFGNNQFKKKMTNSSGETFLANDQPDDVVACPDPRDKEPKEPAFTCPVCWGPFVEEYSTICGHIFCHTCIETSIKAQKRCPTCRKKLNKRNMHRVYLPTAI